MHTECTVCHERLETAAIPALARIDISEADATLSTSIYEYDGGYMKPGVVVKLMIHYLSQVRIILYHISIIRRLVRQP